MSDLTERLTILHGQASRESGRSAVTAIHPSLLANTLKEAADEIDRLRAALELALPILEITAQRFSGGKEELEAVKAALGKKA